MSDLASLYLKRMQGRSFVGALLEVEAVAIVLWDSGSLGRTSEPTGFIVIFESAARRSRLTVFLWGSVWEALLVGASVTSVIGAWNWEKEVPARVIGLDQARLLLMLSMLFLRKADIGSQREITSCAPLLEARSKNSFTQKSDPRVILQLKIQVIHLPENTLPAYLLLLSRRTEPRSLHCIPLPAFQGKPQISKQSQLCECRWDLNVDAVQSKVHIYDGGWAVRRLNSRSKFMK